MSASTYALSASSCDLLVMLLASGCRITLDEREPNITRLVISKPGVILPVGSKAVHGVEFIGPFHRAVARAAEWYTNEVT